MAIRPQLKVFRALWGVIKQADGPWTIEQAIPKIAKAGYAGIECPIVTPMNYGIPQFRKLLDDHKLEYIGMAFTDGPVAPGFDSRWQHRHAKPSRDVARHLDILRQQLEECSAMRSVKVNCHTGNDYMTRLEMEKLFQGALEIEKKYSFSVMHETHRKRALHSPWHARDLLPAFPQLKLAADFSHWVCVAETNAQDPVLTEAIHNVASQVHHIHARIGYDHGPQVPDPRDARWKEYVTGHLSWWRHTWKQMSARGDKVITVTPEHGPPNYQVVEPNTGRPLADIWDVNTWVGEQIKAEFTSTFKD